MLRSVQSCRSLLTRQLAEHGRPSQFAIANFSSASGDTAKGKTILMLGGGSGCVANIICDRLTDLDNDYKIVVAGRTKMEPRNGAEVDFIPFDMYEENASQNLIKAVTEEFGDVSAVVNCISTGGKISYDTTEIAYKNYVSVNSMVHLAEGLDATLVHMSSMKVGNPEDFSTAQIEGKPLWRGARSPYAWSKLAAELKLTTSKVDNMSFIRIGLMDSPHALRFYTRVRAYCDFRVVVTDEKDLQDSIVEAIEAKGRHITTVPHHFEQNGDFYKRMSGRSLLFPMPISLFNIIFGNLLPTKMVDYVDPTHNFEYKLPF